MVLLSSGTVLLAASSALAIQHARLHATRPWRHARTPRAGIDSFELELFSPAKINLFLRILGRRDDGFHDIASLCQTVDLGDRLRLARIPAGSTIVRPSRVNEPIKQHAELTVSPPDPTLPCDETNLVVRALALFRNKLTERDGGSLDVPRFRAHLVKQIPGDAGLSGAASNAATALFGANELCGRPASTDELVQWSSVLGGDVATFLCDTGSSYCTGRGVFHRGDKVTSIQALSGPGNGEGFIVQPVAKVTTPQIFRALAGSGYGTVDDADPEVLLTTIRQDGLLGSAAHCVNDLEPPAFECCPDLAAVKDALIQREGFDAVVMSGSGTALWVMGRPQDSVPKDFAQRFARECHELDGLEVRVWPARFVKRERDGWYTCEDKWAQDEV